MARYLCGLGCVNLLAACVGVLHAGTVERPSILVLVADDAGWEDFGAYGHPSVQTPTIDALSEAGWTADNAFLTSSQCSPSRISILTGRHPHQTGTEDLHVPLPTGHRLVSSHLSDAGYFTGMMEKSHLGDLGEAQFDWYSEGRDLDGFLKAADGRPFFLWVGFRDPHRGFGDAPRVYSPDDVRLPPTVVDTPETRMDYARYYDEISRMDTHIEIILLTLEEYGLLSNTFVLFLSDNGAPMPRAKATLYDAGIKTPLIVSGPDVALGVRYQGLVSTIDLAPTFLSWAGVEKPHEMVGEDLLAQIANPLATGRDYVFSQRNWHNADEHMRSIRDFRFKLIWNNYVHLPHGTPADISLSPTWQALRQARDQGALSREQALLFQVPRNRVELYDLEADQNELNDLSGYPEYRDRLQSMMSRLEAWMRATGDSSPLRRRRDDNVDRVTGAKFTLTNPPLIDGDER